MDKLVYRYLLRRLSERLIAFVLEVGYSSESLL